MKTILFISVIILVIGCRTIKEKEVIHNIYNDSIRYVEKVKIDTIKIKADTVALFIDCNDSKPKAQTKRSGRSSVLVEPSGSGYVIMAVCDSLQRLAISYQKEIFKLKTVTQKESQFKRVELTSWQSFWIVIGKIFTALFILISIWIISHWKDKVF